MGQIVLGTRKDGKYLTMKDLKTEKSAVNAFIKFLELRDWSDIDITPCYDKVSNTVVSVSDFAFGLTRNVIDLISKVFGPFKVTILSKWKDDNYVLVDSYVEAGEEYVIDEDGGYRAIPNSQYIKSVPEKIGYYLKIVNKTDKDLPPILLYDYKKNELLQQGPFVWINDDRYSCIKDEYKHKDYFKPLMYFKDRLDELDELDENTLVYYFPDTNIWNDLTTVQVKPFPEDVKKVLEETFIIGTNRMPLKEFKKHLK
jgi:hypothetical protein